jgi:Na+/melibiose symporter-like transporter
MGIVVGGYVGGRLIAAGQMLAAYLFVVVALALAGLITGLDLRGLTKREPILTESEDEPKTSNLTALLTPRLRPYLWWLLNRYLFVIGLTTIRVFGFFFIQDYLRFDNPAQVIGNLIAAIGIVVGLVAFPVGWLGDRIGRRWLMLGAMLLATVTMPGLLWVTNSTQLWLVGAGLGIAAATFQSVGWAMAMNLIPTASAGRYLGLANVANAGGSLTARLVIGLLIDTLNRQQAGQGYTAMVLSSALCFALAGLALIRLYARQQGDKET